MGCDQINQPHFTGFLGIMHNGQSIIDDYGQSLDRLKVGDRVGVLRKENGDLHFYVNGIDQGVATSVPDAVYGVIDCKDKRMTLLQQLLLVRF